MSLFNPSGNVKKYAMGAIQAAQGAGNENLAGMRPYAQQGGAGFGMLSDLLGVNGQANANNAMANYRSAPSYQFQLQEGLGAINNSAAARGGLMSGATLKALQGYGQNLADQDFQQHLKNLGGLGAMGMQAEGQMGNYRNQVSNAVQQGYSQIGNAQASQNAGYLGAGMNILGSAASLFGGPAMSGLGKLFSPASGTVGSVTQIW